MLAKPGETGGDTRTWPTANLRYQMNWLDVAQLQCEKKNLEAFQIVATTEMRA